MGGLRPHDETFRRRRQAVGRFRRRIVAVENAAASQCAVEIGRFRRGFMQDEGGADHGGVVRGEPGNSSLPARAEWASRSAGHSASTKARAACPSRSRPARRAGRPHKGGDRQAVPVGEDLVVEAGSRTRLARASRRRARMAPGGRLPVARSGGREPIEDLVAFPVSVGGHVVVAANNAASSAQNAVDLGLRPDIEVALLALPIGIERGRRRRHRRRHLARQPGDDLVGALAEEWPRVAREPAPGVRGAGHCRRASSRNGARASGRRRSNGRSRRRDDRGCHPAPCARACVTKRSRAQSPVRSAWRQRSSRIAALGNFGAPARPPLRGSKVPLMFRTRRDRIAEAMPGFGRAARERSFRSGDCARRGPAPHGRRGRPRAARRRRPAGRSGPRGK